MTTRRLTLALRVLRAAAVATALTTATLTVIGPARWLTTTTTTLAAALLTAFATDHTLTRIENRDRYRQERDWSKR